MIARFFVDTNVLVYPHDRREPEKGHAAIALLGTLADAGDGAVSTQVLGEYFWVITRRLPDPLAPREGADSAARHARAWKVLDITFPVVREALRGVVRHRLPYWDALVWATARLAQIPVVLSDDFADGREIEGVRFRNPFQRGFALRG